MKSHKPSNKTSLSSQQGCLEEEILAQEPMDLAEWILQTGACAPWCTQKIPSLLCFKMINSICTARRDVLSERKVLAHISK